jgi:PPOX class probable FMN-dependent enzyme
MSKHFFPKTVASAADLAALIGTPSELALKKQLSSLDHHMVSFISQSPFVLLATVGKDLRCDVSPRGDIPGFVRVMDSGTLLIPERTGNRRADSLKNIIETGSLGVLFLIPGMVESLRVNGRSTVIADEELLAPLAVQGKAPVVGIVLEIEECFLQCGKALLRSQLWAARDQAEAAVLPSFGEMLMDQAKLDNDTVASLDERIHRSYETLY